MTGLEKESPPAAVNEKGKRAEAEKKRPAFAIIGHETAFLNGEGCIGGWKSTASSCFLYCQQEMLGFPKINDSQQDQHLSKTQSLDHKLFRSLIVVYLYSDNNLPFIAVVIIEKTRIVQHPPQFVEQFYSPVYQRNNACIWMSLLMAIFIAFSLGRACVIHCFATYEKIEKPPLLETSKREHYQPLH